MSNSLSRLKGHCDLVLNYLSGSVSYYSQPPLLTVFPPSLYYEPHAVKLKGSMISYCLSLLLQVPAPQSPPLCVSYFSYTVTKQIPDINNLKQGKINFSSWVLDPMHLGRTSWWQKCEVRELFHLVVEGKQRETGRDQGQDTIKDLS
jgi:hypothetical protein